MFLVWACHSWTAWFKVYTVISELLQRKKMTTLKCVKGCVRCTLSREADNLDNSLNVLSLMFEVSEATGGNFRSCFKHVFKGLVRHYYHILSCWLCLWPRRINSRVLNMLLTYTHKTHQAFIGLVVNLQPKSAGYGLTTFVSSAK